jgi:hypothetical protein
MLCRNELLIAATTALVCFMPQFAELPQTAVFGEIDR